MPIGFGFSIGDFIAVLNLVKTVIDALKTSGGAKDSFKELVRQLYALEKALIRVKDIELDDEQEADRIALHHAASQCQQTIDGFVAKVFKYQPHLGSVTPAPTSFARMKAAFKAIKWALCREEDIVKLKMDLNAHVISIELLLLAVQMNKASFDARKEKRRSNSLVIQLRDTANAIFRKFAAVAQQLKQLQEVAQNIVRTNMQIFHTITAVHDMLTRVPPTVQREQPVILTDPFGKISPFHLEFIRSKECFIAVLRIHFQQAGASTSKLDEGEYFVEEPSCRRHIDLGQSWERCFQPGQHVAMSIVFRHLRQEASNACPGCEAICVTQDNEDIDCPRCGIHFKRIVELTDDSPRFRTYASQVSLRKSPLASDTSLWPFRWRKKSSAQIYNDPLFPEESILSTANCKRRIGPNEEAEREGLKKFRRLGYYPPEAQGLNCKVFALWDAEPGKQTLLGSCKAAVYNIDGSPVLNVREIRPKGWTLIHENMLEMGCDVHRVGDDEIVFSGTLKYPRYPRQEPPQAHTLRFENRYACSTIWFVIPGVKKKSTSVDFGSSVASPSQILINEDSTPGAQQPVATEEPFRDVQSFFDPSYTHIDDIQHSSLKSSASPPRFVPPHEWSEVEQDSIASTMEEGDSSFPSSSPASTFVWSGLNGQSMQPKAKRKMTTEERKVYKETRKRGACQKCRKQKAGCIHMADPGEHLWDPCLRKASPPPEGSAWYTETPVTTSQYTDYTTPAKGRSASEPPDWSFFDSAVFDFDRTQSYATTTTQAASNVILSTADHGSNAYQPRFEHQYASMPEPSNWPQYSFECLPPDEGFLSFDQTASHGLGVWGAPDAFLWDPSEAPQNSEGQQQS